MPDSPSGHDSSDFAVRAYSFAVLSFLLLMMSVAVSAQQPLPLETPIKQLSLLEAESTSGPQEEGLVTGSLKSDSAANTDPSNETGSPSRVTEESTSDVPSSSEETADSTTEEFRNRITNFQLDQKGEAEKFKLRPEVFIQGRFSFGPLKCGDSDPQSHFNFTNLEVAWEGKIAAHFGVGVEIQFDPLIDGEVSETINDAYIDYYLNDNFNVRVGQFIKPFGFDVQQSSTVRESPERGMFAGYFFPGEHDRGVVISGNMDFLGIRASRGITYSFGLFRGNRFFSDDEPQFNYVVRARKVFSGGNFALGVSMQRGHQNPSEGLEGKSPNNIFGVDFQYIVGRVGLRGEFVVGDTPSSLFTEDSEPGFSSGSHAAGGALFFAYRLSNKDNLYARYDQFNGDPQAGRAIRAFNFGYFRQIGKFSRLSFDYQLKNRSSFNDDAVNSRFQTTWSTIF